MLVWLKRHKNKVIGLAAVLAVLAFSFFYGGGNAKRQADTPLPSPGATVEPGVSPEQKGDTDNGVVSDEPGGKTDLQNEEEAASSAEPEAEPTPPPASGPAEPTPTDERPDPVEPEDTSVGTEAYSCVFSISCATILDNIALLDEAKHELVPSDGWILEPVTVTFYEGESVFNVLQREMKQRGIHMEFRSTPVYNSVFIEGLNNLYEFDVGELSGWMYQVNGWFPNYGCSRYQLQDGDVIAWVYTCDLGSDVGDTGGGQQLLLN